MITPTAPRRLLAGLSLGLVALHGSLSHAADAVPAAPARGNPAAPPAPAIVNAPLRPPLPVSQLSPAVTLPAVAIARPSPEEVAIAKAALDKFSPQADAATKAVLAKYPTMLEVRPPRANNLLIPGLNAGYRQKHANNVARIAEGPIDLMFMGDSITDSWRTTGRAVFEKYYGQYRTANFGIGGDTIQGVLYRLRDGEGEGYSPKAIMLMIGTNNTPSSTSAEIAEGIGAIVHDMRTRFPAAKILLLGIFPRADPGTAPRNTALGVNPIIAKLHDGKNIFYMDIGDKFLDPSGAILHMPDKLHPNAAGYEVWAEAVKDKVAELMK